jgi:hypothetical protein
MELCPSRAAAGAAEPFSAGAASGALEQAASGLGRFIFNGGGPVQSHVVNGLLHFCLEDGGGDNDGCQRTRAVDLPLDGVEELLEHVATAQNEFDDGRINRQLALPREVEQRFEHMRETVDGNQI